MKKAERDLIRKYLKGTANPREISEIQNLIEENPALKGLIGSSLSIENIAKEYADYKDFQKQNDKKEIHHFISEKKHKEKKISSSLVLKVASIAALFILIFITSIILIRPDTIQQTTEAKIDFSPGSYGANITLADGEVIQLNKANDTLLTDKDANVKIKVADNCVFLNSIDNSTKKNINSLKKTNVRQTIQTGPKQEFIVVLPDSTKIWLNAETTIKYSIGDFHSNRSVELSGEAFFDVRKNKDKPFIVVTENQQVTVTGTKFSITSYPENLEERTILLEGVVELQSQDSKEKIILSPNQLAVLSSVDKFEVKNVNASLLTSWRFSSFAFEYESFYTVAQKLSKWYGVNFEFMDSGIENYHFSGTLPKYENISRSLELLELTSDIKFIYSDENTIQVVKK